MTRINYAIPVHALSDTLLFAEHREMKRICAFYSKGSRTPKDAKFTPTGPGHVLFFIDKPNYTFMRQLMIEVELRDRGLNYTSYLRNWTVVYHDLMRWSETDKRQVFRDGTIECQPTRSEQLSMANRLLFCIDRAIRETQPYAGDPVGKEDQKTVMRKMLGELNSKAFKYSGFDAEFAKNLPVQPAEYLHCTATIIEGTGGIVEPKFRVKVFVWDTREVIGTFECGRVTLGKISTQLADDNGLALSTTPIVPDIVPEFKHWTYLKEVLPEIYMR